MMWHASIDDGDGSLEFEDFEAAKGWLLDQLWWLAEDNQHEQTFEAWAEVATWSESKGSPMAIAVGDPIGMYRLERKR